MAVAPAWDEARLCQTFGDMEAKDGDVQMMKMKDGWEIKRESWSPAQKAKAVLLFHPGGGESTRTIGARRFAKACTKRGIIFSSFDPHGEGESKKKDGKETSAVGYPVVDSAGVWKEHMVEIAEALIDEHKLPLIIAGHSSGGLAATMSTDSIIELCEKKVSLTLVAIPEHSPRRFQPFFRKCRVCPSWLGSTSRLGSG